MKNVQSHTISSRLKSLVCVFAGALSCVLMVPTAHADGASFSVAAYMYQGYPRALTGSNIVSLADIDTSLLEEFQYDTVSDDGTLFSEDGIDYFLDFYGCRYQLESEEAAVRGRIARKEMSDALYKEDPHIGRRVLAGLAVQGVIAAFSSEPPQFIGRAIPVRPINITEPRRGNFGCDSSGNNPIAIALFRTKKENGLGVGIFQPSPVDDDGNYMGSGSMAFIVLKENWFTPAESERIEAFGEIALAIAKILARQIK